MSITTSRASDGTATGTGEAMTAKPAAGDAVFPSTDHFPLGRAYGRVDAAAQEPTGHRPFGLRLAVAPRVIRFDPAELGYDDERQIGLIRAGGVMVPLAKHTDGTTNTQTNADGQSGPDSDSDVRED